MDLTIYHNPRCSKSRQTLALLNERDLEPVVIDYLSTPPDRPQLEFVLRSLSMAPRDLMRKGEAVYGELGLDDPSLGHEQLLDAMIENPILIERPIVVCNGQVRIGRPPESVLDII